MKAESRPEWWDEWWQRQPYKRFCPMFFFRLEGLADAGIETVLFAGNGCSQGRDFSSTPVAESMLLTFLHSRREWRKSTPSMPTPSKSRHCVQRPGARWTADFRRRGRRIRALV